MLDIIFRSCSRPEAQVHGTTRIVDKPECVVKCFRSLANSAQHLSIPYQITIIDDHSSPEVIAKLLELVTIQDKFIPLSSTGNGESLDACYKYADEFCHDLIYFVEDDYLHESSALSEMVDAYYIFKRNLSREVAVYPLDCNDRYKPDMMEPCYIVPGQLRYWRTITSTTGTFMLHKSIFLGFRELFHQFTFYGKDPRVHESTTINNIWKHPLGAVCFSPLPTLAYHLQLEEHLPFYTDYHKLWSSLT